MTTRRSFLGLAVASAALSKRRSQAADLDFESVQRELVRSMLESGEVTVTVQAPVERRRLKLRLPQAGYVRFPEDYTA